MEGHNWKTLQKVLKYFFLNLCCKMDSFYVEYHHQQSEKSICVGFFHVHMFTAVSAMAIHFQVTSLLVYSGESCVWELRPLHDVDPDTNLHEGGASVWLTVGELTWLMLMTWIVMTLWSNLQWHSLYWHHIMTCNDGMTYSSMMCYMAPFTNEVTQNLAPFVNLWPSGILVCQGNGPQHVHTAELKIQVPCVWILSMTSWHWPATPPRCNYYG